MDTDPKKRSSKVRQSCVERNEDNTVIRVRGADGVGGRYAFGDSPIAHSRGLVSLSLISSCRERLYLDSDFVWFM